MKVVGKAKREQGIDLWDQPEPKIAEGNQVILEVSACGICGTDVIIYEWDHAHMVRRLQEMDLPRVLGHEIAGTVREVGRGVTAFKAGDRVVFGSSGGCRVCPPCRLGIYNVCDFLEGHDVGIELDGGYARFVVTRDYELLKIPEGLSFEEAAVIQPLTIALHGLEEVT